MTPTPTRSPARRRAVLAAAVALLATLLAPATSAAPAPNGSTWSETWIDTPDGERLHVDVMRPEGMPDTRRTPVILVVSPYLGMTSPTDQPGPSDRFHDFFEGARVFARGYSVVMVSLRGTGGSSGCLDILGPGEQTDVVTAVRWSASQPWSTGKVGMYGKSYDANTGVVGAALRPRGLAAVVAQQVVPDRYRGSYNDRVRFAQSLLYPSATYGVAAEGGFSVNGRPEYAANSVSRSGDCQALLAEHYRDDPDSRFWRDRDFVERGRGSRVPVLMTTGYVDEATNIGGGAVDFFAGLRGPKRLWIGWWDHVRGNDLAGDDTPAMGRRGWFDEVMRFYDEHLKGIRPQRRDPVVAAQTSTGRWTAEAQWPARDVRPITAPLLPGTYADDGRNRGSNDTAAGPGGAGPVGESPTTGAGAWTFSSPLRRTARLAGIPSARVVVSAAVPRTNVVVNVYDVAPDGSATMITRGAALTDGGAKLVALWPTDWTFRAGHRIGVLVSGANSEAYVHAPTRQTVTVESATVTLPWLSTTRRAATPGSAAARLETWRETAPFEVPAETIEQRTDSGFPLPS